MRPKLEKGRPAKAPSKRPPPRVRTTLPPTSGMGALAAMQGATYEDPRVPAPSKVRLPPIMRPTTPLAKPLPPKAKPPSKAPSKQGVAAVKAVQAINKAAKGGHVAELQQHLVDLGYHIDVDGIWGPQSKKAYAQAGGLIKKTQKQQVERRVDKALKNWDDTSPDEKVKLFGFENTKNLSDARARDKAVRQEALAYAPTPEQPGLLDKVGAVAKAIPTELARSAIEPIMQGAWGAGQEDQRPGVRLPPGAAGAAAGGATYGKAFQAATIGPDLTNYLLGQTYHPTGLKMDLAMLPLLAVGKPLRAARVIAKMGKLASEGGHSLPEVRAIAEDLYHGPSLLKARAATGAIKKRQAVDDALIEAAIKSGRMSKPHEQALRDFAAAEKEVRRLAAIAKTAKGEAKKVAEDDLKKAQAARKTIKGTETYERARAYIKPDPLPVDDPRYAAREAIATQLIKDLKGTKNALPPGSTKAKIHSLFRFLDTMADAGIWGRTWYEDSANAILDITKNADGEFNRDKAEKFAQLVAIYSPQQPIIGNTSLAIRASAEWNAAEQALREAEGGGAVTVGQDWQQDAANAVMQGRGDWDGRKTNNFYVNFLEDIDPVKFQKLVDQEIENPGTGIRPDGVTIDMWMARVFGYTSDDVTAKGRYDFMEEIVRQLARERGEDWKPKQVQAAIWTAIKGISDDATANIDFATGIERHFGQFNFGAGAGFTDDFGVIYRNWPPEVQHMFQTMNARLVDNFVREVGLMAERGVVGPAVQAGEAVPATSMRFLTSAAPREGTGLRVFEPERVQITRVAAAIGRALKLNEVDWIRPWVDKALMHEGTAHIDIGRVPTAEEAQSLWHALNPEGVERFSVVNRHDGFMVRNVSDLVNNGTKKNPGFRQIIEETVPKALKDIPESDTKFHASDGERLQSEDYGAHLQFGDGGGPGEDLRFTEAADRLASEADDLRSRFVEVSQGFADQADEVTPAAVARELDALEALHWESAARRDDLAAATRWADDLYGRERPDKLLKPDAPPPPREWSPEAARAHYRQAVQPGLHYIDTPPGDFTGGLSKDPRVPALYLADSDSVFIGQPGWTHGDLHNAIGERVGTNPPDLGIQFVWRPAYPEYNIPEGWLEPNEAAFFNDLPPEAQAEIQKIDEQWADAWSRAKTMVPSDATMRNRAAATPQRGFFGRLLGEERGELDPSAFLPGTTGDTRTLRAGQLEVQMPHARARTPVTRLIPHGIENTADWISRLADSDLLNKHPNFWTLTETSRATKQAGRLKRLEPERRVAAFAKALRTITGIKEGSLADIANYWYAQLPEAWRNTDGLALIRDHQARFRDKIASGERMNELNAEQQALRDEMKALEESGEQGQAPWWNARGKVGTLEEVKADLVLQLKDLSASTIALDKLIAAAPPPNHEALDALRTLVADRERILTTAGRLKNEAVDERPGLLAKELGLEPDGSEIYIGHRLGKDPNSGFTRFLPSIGTGRVKSPPGMGRNQRVLLETGRLRPSLRIGVEDWQAAGIFDQTVGMRHDIWKMGTPFTGRAREGYLKGHTIVNIKGRVIPRHWRTDELSQFGDDWAEVEDIRLMAQEMLDGFAIDKPDAWREMIEAVERGEVRHEDLRVIPNAQLERYAKQFRSSTGRSAPGAVGDMLIDMVATSIVFARIGYIPKNVLQNAIMAVPHQGPLLIRNIVRASQVMRDPELADYFLAEAGFSGASAALGQEATKGRWTGNVMRSITGFVGGVADNPFRVAAVLHEMAAEGVINRGPGLLTDVDRKKLAEFFTQKKHEALKNDINWRANNALADFTRLTPDQSRILRRVMIIPGWMVAGSRYPFHFAATHPIRSALIAYIAMGEPGAPEELRFNEPVTHYLHGRRYLRGVDTPFGRLRTSSLNPVSTPWEIAIAAKGSITGKTGPFDYDTETLWNIAAPLPATVVEWARGEGDLGRTANRLIPNAALIQSLISPPSDTKSYPGDVSRTTRMQRELGVIPIPVSDAARRRRRGGGGLGDSGLGSSSLGESGLGSSGLGP